jgi:hypothetical protein
MKTSHLCFALFAGAFLSGCAHDRAGSTAGEPDNGTAGNPRDTISAAASSNAAPLNYQWYFKGTNINEAGDPLKPARSEPVNRAVEGSSAPFNVSTASNGGPLFYQWFKNDTNIDGTTNR